MGISDGKKERSFSSLQILGASVFGGCVGKKCGTEEEKGERLPTSTSFVVGGLFLVIAFMVIFALAGFTSILILVGIILPCKICKLVKKTARMGMH